MGLMNVAKQMDVLARSGALRNFFEKPTHIEWMKKF